MPYIATSVVLVAGMIAAINFLPVSVFDVTYEKPVTALEKNKSENESIEKS